MNIRDIAERAGYGVSTVSRVINGQSNGTIETANAIVTIMDDDQSIWTIAQDTDSLSEGAGSNGYTVSRSGAYGATATIVVSSSGGTATAGATDDYTALAQTLTFAPGQTTQRVNVSVRDDFLMESLETFNVSLSAASTGTIETSAVTTTRNGSERDQGVRRIRSPASTVMGLRVAPRPGSRCRGR